ncbi:uncharacterized protein N7459_003722 [Penicillium hispanicum]|uniref:uncharacterized protein n=1 Tax=Penicillium hispanicum TaxID=1080232 RepID=UPI0025401B7C|nr:uncharacterized protein N7459_003722 [Penicillium hispanicum]KAJ5587957.1 hypothetical protein N7459_003722 [Penicillium hispanicum]
MTAVLAPRDQHSQSQIPPDLLQSPTAQRYFLEDNGFAIKSPMQHESSTRECSSPVATTLSSASPSPTFAPAAQNHLTYSPTTFSTFSLDDDLILPSYDADSAAHSAGHEEPDVLSEVSVEASTSPVPWTCGTPAADDTSIEVEPSRHVDYLSHDWREEDIWASWRYVTARKSDYSNGVRLENASWRTWAKAKNHLGTISPETLNWLKDCDVTWLYGPLKTSSSSDAVVSDASPPPSRLDTPNSYLERKPILKKRTASETILQQSLSQHTLLQHAGAILKAQEAEHGWTRPPFPRSNTDLDQIHHRTGSSTYSLGGTLTASSSSGLTSPSERRHIHFNNEVVQCIAVEAKEGDDEDGWPVALNEESSSDDDIVMMQQISSNASISNRTTPRNSFGSESKTIAPLPSTTLKYRGDTPESRGGSILDRWTTQPPSSTLSPTPSVETLRPSPSSTSANFLLDEDDEDPSLDFTGHYTNQNQPWFVPEAEDELSDRPLRLTASGMFMPYNEGEGEGEGELVSNGLLGRVVDTVNTARDIAHVIWNVGWRR